MGLIAILAAVCPAADQDEALARRLEHRLEELGRRWQAENAYFRGKETPLASRAAMLSDWDENSKQAKEAAALLGRLIETDEKIKAPVVLEMTIVGRRLQRYKETGDISAPSVAEVAQLKDELAHPWTHWTPDPKLSGDIVELQSQVREAGRLLDRLPEVAKKTTAPPPAPAPRTPKLSAGIAKTPARPMKSLREEPATLPDLMDWLASPDPRRRALAADELGTRDKAAAPALPELRRALSDPDARVRASTVLAISTIAAPTPDIVQEIRRALSDKNEDVKLSARTALERLEQPAIRP
jgi:hypothetical protein